ncbi:MAG: hypothetical protein EOM70_01620 [Clostridia bacterium]|nr:hypothetical protein [Clostridia bacterium]
MEKRLKRYLSDLETLLNQSALTRAQCQSARADLLVQIGFFQHERLIHLIVTVTFAILALLALLGLALSENIGFAALLFMVLVLLLPYIRFYYLLEKGVQKLYDYYDRLSSCQA